MTPKRTLKNLKIEIYDRLFNIPRKMFPPAASARLLLCHSASRRPLIYPHPRMPVLKGELIVVCTFRVSSCVDSSVGARSQSDWKATPARNSHITNGRTRSGSSSIRQTSTLDADGETNERDVSPCIMSINFLCLWENWSKRNSLDFRRSRRGYMNLAGYATNDVRELRLRLRLMRSDGRSNRRNIN